LSQQVTSLTENTNVQVQQLADAKVGASKLNRMQVKATLDVLAEVVISKGVSAKKLVVIAAHKPNVEYGNTILRNYPSILSRIHLGVSRP
jgi:predicted acyltransferase (DUF342 family)